MSSKTAKANKMWREKGEKTRETVFDYLLEHPHSTSYQIAKNISLTPAGVTYHLEALEQEGKVERQVQLLNNKGCISYTVAEKVPYKLYLWKEYPLILKWEKGQQLYLSVERWSGLILTSKVTKTTDRGCLARIPLIYCHDNKGYYVILPVNLVRFYGLQRGERRIEQSVSYHPFSRLFITITDPLTQTVVVPIEDSEF